MHACMHTYVHTHMQAHIHSYTHIYIHGRYVHNIMYATMSVRDLITHCSPHVDKGRSVDEGPDVMKVEEEETIP